MSKISSESNNLSKLTRIQLEQMIIHLKAELSLFKFRLKEFEQEFNYKQFKKLTAERDALFIQLDEVQNKLEQLDIEKNSLLVQVNELEKNNREFQKQAKQTETEKRSLRIVVARLENDLKDFKDKFKKMEDEQIEVEKEKNLYKKERTELHADFDKKIQEKDDIIRRLITSIEEKRKMEQELRQFILTLINDLADDRMKMNEKVHSKVEGKIEELAKKLSREKKSVQGLNKNSPHT